MLRAAVRFAPLLASLPLLLAACGGASDAPSSIDGANEDEAALETATIPLGSYKLVRKSGTSRALTRLTLERNKRFTAEMEIEGERNPLLWWAPAPSETKIVKGSYRTSRDRPSVMDTDQRVRDGIWLEYEDPTYSYDHFSYEYRAPRLTLTALSKEIVLESDPGYEAPAEPAAIEVSCTVDRGEATMKLTLDENRNTRGKLAIVRNRMADFPASVTVTVGYDNMLSDRERMRFRGMKGDQGFDVIVPRTVIEGDQRGTFSASFTWEPDQGGIEKGFTLSCKR